MPQVQLEEISFNHSTGRSSGSISIQNEGELVTAPEWRRGTIKPEDSLVAYAINQQREVITIRARLSSPDRRLTKIEVQAIADAGNVLGNVQSRTVTFNSSGQSEILPFTLPAPRFRELGVNVGTGSWGWEYRIRPADDWTKFDDTAHQIYVLVDTPVEPWDSEVPWAEVLDIACDWAKGAQDADEAASKITREVYALGDPLAVPLKKLISYQRTSTYAQGTFDLSGFLGLLRGDVDAPARVNCDDCATIVSTFGNILGCNLSQSEMGDVFHTLHIRLIGELKWTRPTFPRHAVAWKNESLKTDPLFDACLKVDGDDDPADHSDFTEIVPVNTPFAGSGNYRFRLYRAGNCQARPERKKRRPLGIGFLGQVKYTDPVLLAFLKFIYDFENWPPEDPQDGNSGKGPIKFLPSLPAFVSWQSGEGQRFEDEDVTGVRYLLKRIDTHTRNLVEVNYYKVKASIGINDFVLQLLAQFHQSDVKRETENTLGRLTFVEPCDKAVVFVREDIIAFVRSVGRDSISVFDIATTIDMDLACYTTMEGGDVKMANRFEGTWSCFIVHFDDDDQYPYDHELKPIGTMRLEFKPNGDLERGELEYGGDEVHLTGTSTRIGEPRIMLESEFHDGFEGILTFESDDLKRFAATGKLHLASDSRLKRRLVEDKIIPNDQDDPPWVITKP